MTEKEEQISKKTEIGAEQRTGKKNWKRKKKTEDAILLTGKGEKKKQRYSLENKRSY
jgi:hypothetical protein